MSVWCPDREVREQIDEIRRANKGREKFYASARLLVKDCLERGGDVEGLKEAIGLTNRWNLNYLDGLKTGLDAEP